VTEPAGAAPRFLLEPETVIVEAVCAVEPGMDPREVARVVRLVLATRTLQRRVARALAADPTLLVSGESGGPPRLAALIRALRQAGARSLAVPCCATCRREVALVGLSSDGRRICSTCQGRANRTLVACSRCAVSSRVGGYDAARRALCVRCAIAERTVDHLSVVVDHLVGLDTGLSRARLRTLVAEAVPSAHKQRDLRGELDTDLDLLRVHPAAGSARVVAVAQALIAAGARNVAAPTCPFCGRVVRLKRSREGFRCCGRCYDTTRTQECCRCGRDRLVTSRTPGGGALCAACTSRDPVNHRRCPTCGRTTILFRAVGGAVAMCAACNGLPRARCTVCGKDKPCRHTASGAPRCVACTVRLRGPQACSQCGAARPVYARRATGQALCVACAGRREVCAVCGRVQRVVARPPRGPLCATCWRKDPAARRACIRCGTVEVPYHFGLCAACACPQVLADLLTDPDAGLRPGAGKVLDVLACASDPTALLGWAAKPGPRALLVRLAREPGQLSHDLLDAVAVGRHPERLRATLVAAGALPARDEQLVLLEHWLTGRLGTVADPGERAALQRFATWHYLARLRRRSAAVPVTPGQDQGVRIIIGMSVALLAWLHGRGRTLATATQHDIDDWLAAGGDHHRARMFLVWAVRSGHTHHVRIPIQDTRYVRHVLPETDHRWTITRRLLHDETIHLPDRVAGLLVVLFAQSPADIVRLTAGDVVLTAQSTTLRLGPAPVHLPEPLDGLLRALIQDRSSTTLLGPAPDQPWLFPGRSPGRPMITHRLGTRLRALGVPARLTRNTALMDLAGQLPAPVLAQLLGLNIITATRWTQEAGNTRPSYAAATARANTTGTVGH
jgi:hypothetical protein